jgi:RNA polymerase sigma factor (sigma-70 family)
MVCTNATRTVTRKRRDLPMHRAWLAIRPTPDQNRDRPVDGGADSDFAAANGRLVRMCRRGLQGSWEELVRQHSPWMETVARGQGLDPQTAQDAVQTTWIHLYTSLRRLRSDEAVAGWLSRAVRREAIRLSKRRRRHDQETHLEERSGAVDERLLTEELRLHVRRAVGELSSKQQRLLWLLFSDEERSYQEIAEIMNCPIGSIGATRGRALRHLARSLSVISRTAGL